MRMLGSGQMFGGGAMLHPENGYPVTAEAMEDSTALAWEAYGFEKLAEKNPVLSVNMMCLMQAYVQEMQSRYLEISTERVEQRLARSLVRLTSQMGIKTGGLIELSFSRQDLAEMSGTTLYSASRILADWARRGIIETGRERVRIMNPHGLVAIAEDLG